MKGNNVEPKSATKINTFPNEFPNSTESAERNGTEFSLKLSHTRPTRGGWLGEEKVHGSYTLYRSAQGNIVSKHEYCSERKAKIYFINGCENVVRSRWKRPGGRGVN